MTQITVLGGTGYAGRAIVEEARKRGLTVTSVSRSTPTDPIAGVDYVIGSVLHERVLQPVIENADCVIVALSPRKDSAFAAQEAIVEELIRRLDRTSTRLGYVGGASSLLTEPGGPRLWDVSRDSLPEEAKPEIELGLWVYDRLARTAHTLDYFYVSPPAEFGSWLGTPSKGRYVLGGDVLLGDEDGNSTISAADLAIAILDEVERPAHRRARFTAIS